MPDRNKPNCFELYATGGNDFIKGTNGTIACEYYIEKKKTKKYLQIKFFFFRLFFFINKACKTDSEGKVVEGKHTVYRMSAAEQAEKDEWIACIRYMSFSNLFSKKKKNHLCIFLLFILNCACFLMVDLYRQSISHNPFYDMLAARKKKAQKSNHRTKP